jgi:hypothetical protein
VNRHKGFLASFRAGPAFRCLLTLVALFYATEHASVVAHFALVQHVVCDEHGELMDVDVATFAMSASEARPSSEPAWAKSPAPAGHHHEHCNVLAHLRQQLPVPIFAGLPARVAAVPELASAPFESAPPLAVPLYRLAPKNSPPA